MVAIQESSPADHEGTPPLVRKHKKEAHGSDNDFDLVLAKRDTVTRRQTYEGMRQTNPLLPIQSLLAWNKWLTSC